MIFWFAHDYFFDRESIDFSNILYKESEHKNRESVLNWEITVLDWSSGSLYTHSSQKILILQHTDIALFGFCVHFLRTGYTVVIWIKMATIRRSVFRSNRHSIMKKLFTASYWKTAFWGDRFELDKKFRFFPNNNLSFVLNRIFTRFIKEKWFLSEILVWVNWTSSGCFRFVFDGLSNGFNIIVCV